MKNPIIQPDPENRGETYLIFSLIFGIPLLLLAMLRELLSIRAGKPR